MRGCRVKTAASGSLIENYVMNVNMCGLLHNFTSNKEIM